MTSRKSSSAWRTCAMLIIASFSTASAQSPRIIRTFVTDSLGQALPYVNLWIGRDITAIADDSGRAALRLPHGREAWIEARRIGFRPETLRLPAGGDTSVVITLRPLAYTLDRALIEAQRISRTLENRGFYQRQRDSEKGINTAWFITAEDIERRRPSYLTHILSDIHGLRMIPKSGCGVRSSCLVPVGSGNCRAMVYINGARVTSLIPRIAGGEETIDELINPSSVAGMEVYTWASHAPAEFQLTGGNCAVILIWTKA